MADEYDLVKTAKIHGPAEHTHVLLAICCIQSSHRFVPEKSFVMNAVTLPHVVDGDAQVNSFIDQNELATGEFVHEASTVQIFIADLDIKIVYHPPTVRPRALRPKADFKSVVEAPFKQRVNQGRDLWSGRLDFAELDLIRAEDPGEIVVVFLLSPGCPEFGLDLEQASPRCLQLVLTLFDLGLARNEAVPFAATGDDQPVGVFSFSS
jgi:hypothetical protein